MGWGAGSHILRETWNRVRDFVPEQDRAKKLAELVKVFWDEDCDTFDDLRGEWPELDKALVLAGWTEEEDEDYE